MNFDQAVLTFNDEGLLHSFNDKPALITREVNVWFNNGVIDREFNQAIELHEDEVYIYIWVKDGVIYNPRHAPVITSSGEMIELKNNIFKSLSDDMSFLAFRLNNSDHKMEYNANKLVFYGLMLYSKK